MDADLPEDLRTPDLIRVVVPVEPELWLRGDRRVIVPSVELWRDRTVVHLVWPVFDAPQGTAIERLPRLVLSDDAGVTFADKGGGMMSTDPAGARHIAHFDPVPETVAVLRLSWIPEGGDEPDGVMELDLRPSQRPQPGSAAREERSKRGHGR